MRLVHSQDTKPEIAVRSLLHKMGLRFRLHRTDLPGKPDIVLAKYKTVVFVHGCFWHRHVNCRAASTPTSRLNYWLPKFERTMARDKRNKRTLERMGWRVLVIWECEIKNADKLIRHVSKFFKKV